MKRAKAAAAAGDDAAAPRQNGPAGRRKGERRQSEEDDGDCNFGADDLQGDDNDPGLRREIRSKYRDLINSVQRE